MRSEPFGVAFAVCFEGLAGVFASSGPILYVKIWATLKKVALICSSPVVLTADGE